MNFSFVTKHRAALRIPVLCEVLGISRSGFYEWFCRRPSLRTRANEKLTGLILQSFEASDQINGSRRVWHDVLAWGEHCGIHRVAPLMRATGLAARKKRLRSPNDEGLRPAHIAPNLLQREFEADAPNRAANTPAKTSSGC